VASCLLIRRHRYRVIDHRLLSEDSDIGWWQLAPTETEFDKAACVSLRCIDRASYSIFLRYKGEDARLDAAAWQAGSRWFSGDAPSRPAMHEALTDQTLGRIVFLHNKKFIIN